MAVSINITMSIENQLDTPQINAQPPLQISPKFIYEADWFAVVVEWKHYEFLVSLKRSY